MKFLARLSGLFPNRSVRSASVAALVLLALGVYALAQDQNQPPPSSQTQAPSQAQSQAQPQKAIRVARISLIEGDVSYQRGGSSDDKTTDWFDATVNLPLDEKDQVYSAKNGRAEIQFSGGTVARVDRDTNLRVTQFNTSTIQLAQSIGTATYRVHSLDRRQFQVYDVKSGSIDDPLYFEVDTPAVAITFLKEGQYRVNVRDDGTTEVIVRKGQAEIYNQELGTVPVKSGRRIIIEGRDAGYYQIAKLNDKDNWDRWNDRRDDDFYARVSSNRSSRYVPASVAGVYDLDDYGEWFETPEYGWVWSPRGVPGGWAPYRAGYWRWYGGWGWTWVSSEPWGWAPYHYGRWNYYRSRWCWTPYINFGVGRVGVGFWDWSPHLVAFFGWGGSYGAGYRNGYWDGYRDGRGWLGWCPLGWGERWGGGYYGRSRTIINNTIIVNNTNHVRDLNGLRNYNAPNGVGGMEGRRFAQPRVMAENITAPPRGSGRLLADDSAGNGSNNSGPGGNMGGNTGRGGGRNLEVARNDVFRPTENEIVRQLPVERNSSVARALDAPVIARRAPVSDGGGMPTRNSLDGGAPARGQWTTERNLPSRDAAMPARNSSGESTLEGIARPERRATEYRPVERVERPTVTRPSSEDRSMPRRESGNSEAGSGSAVPRDRNMPRGDGEVPRRTEAPARSNDRYDMPSRGSERAPERVERPPVERRMPERTEAPRAPERSEPPREYRTPPRESSPSRDSMPSRGADRPPERSAPARESAPSRESRPERPSGNSDRSMPSRKSGN